VLRILLDENLPTALARLLTGHQVETVRSMGWLGIANGALLDRAERHGFEAMVTSDRSIRRQNRMEGRKLALVVISHNDWPTLEAHVERILLALNAVTPASYREVALERPRTRRRRPPGPTL
jgi:hypothetical protein